MAAATLVRDISAALVLLAACVINAGAIVLVQLGQGYVPALATLVGVLIGVALYRPLHRRFLPWELDSCAM